MSLIELTRKHLANVGTAAEPDIYADDIVVEFPFAPKHHTGQLTGKEAVVRYLGRVGVFFTGYNIPSPTFIETGDPNQVITEYHCTATNIETNRYYEQKYVAIVTAKDGKIAHIREYYNPINVLVAFGEMDEPTGE